MHIDHVRSAFDFAHKIEELLKSEVTEVIPAQALMIVFLEEGRKTGTVPYWGTNRTYNLSKLVGLGYVEKQDNKADMRSKVIALTPAGRELKKKILWVIDGAVL